MKLGLEQKILAGFFVALLLLMTVGVASFISTSRLTENARWLAHTQEVIAHLNAFLFTLNDIESAQRGFAATGDEYYLTNYRSKLTYLKPIQHKLKRLTRDNTAQQQRLAELAPVVQSKIIFSDEVIAARQQQGLAAAVQLIADGEGRALQERAHRIVLSMIETEQRLGVQREKASQRTASASQAIVVFGSLLALTVTGVALIIIRRDFVRRRITDEQLRAANQDLRVATQRAQESDRLKSAFLATMSHELRTPLNSIIGFSGILMQGLAGPLNAEQSKQLGMVRKSARHLLALINDLLDISKVEAGELKPTFEMFDVRDVVEHVVASVRPQAQTKGLQLSCEIDARVSGLYSDRRRVYQILLNLLNNAIKFTEQGGVRLLVEVIPAYTEGAGQAIVPASLKFQVSDTGTGIQAQDLASIFQPFFQVDSGLARQREGTGLGLTICRRLAQLMGGDVTAESEWGRGSVFTLRLPLSEDACHGGAIGEQTDRTAD